MTTRRGRKDPTLLARTNLVEIGGGTTYVATRPIAVGELLVPAGVEIPADKLGPRPEAWVRSRRLRLVGPDEKYTTFDEFSGMVDTAIAEAREMLEQYSEDATTEE